MAEKPEEYMDIALRLAKRMMGACSPNPSVGCVLTNGKGKIIGRGWTKAGGRPHAETEALLQAGRQAKGATAYVTLEPCAHRGETGSCAEALRDAGIAKLVCAIRDPDPRVSAKGIEILQKAGVTIMEGVLAEKAESAHHGFFLRIKKGRPAICLKFATDARGIMAGKDKKQIWISNALSRRFAHLMRAEHDAILIGIGTALSDNPSLDCRIEGLESYSPLPVLLDSTLRLPLGSKLLQRDKLLIFHGSQATDKARTRLEAEGAECIELDCDKGRQDIELVGRHLAKRGINNLLVEGGIEIARSFLESKVVDSLNWFQSNQEIGEGHAPFPGFSQKQLEEKYGFQLLYKHQLGQDNWLGFKKG